MEFGEMWKLFLFLSFEKNLSWDIFYSQFQKSGGDKWIIYDIDGNVSHLLWSTPISRNRSICRRLMRNNAQTLWKFNFPHMFTLSLVSKYQNAKQLVEACINFDMKRKELRLFTPLEKVSARIIQHAYFRMVERESRPYGKIYYRSLNEFIKTYKTFSSQIK